MLLVMLLWGCSSGEATEEILTWRFDVPAGTEITPNHIWIQRRPARLVADPVLRSPTEVIGRVSKERVLGREPVRADRLAPEGTAPGPGAAAPAGLVAVRLPSDHPAPVPQPGHLVDVVRRRPEPPFACVIADGARVLGSERADGLVTFDLFEAYVAFHVAVPPEAADALADDPDDVSLWLRDPLDLEPAADPLPACPTRAAAGTPPR